MRSLTVCLALLVLPAASPAVFAQKGGRAGAGQEKRFKELDKDGDKKISAEDLGNKALHERLDRDGDGFVTLEEARGAFRSSRSARETACRAAVLEHCWDERDGFFYSADLNLLPAETHGLHAGGPRHWDCLIQRIGVWSGFLALWAGIASPEQNGHPGNIPTR